jgi:hypothetical protein
MRFFVKLLMKNMQETAANILPGQLFFVRGSI